MGKRLKRFFFCHPMGIFFLTSFVSYTVGRDLISSLIIWLVSHDSAGIFSYSNEYGAVSWLRSIFIIIQQMVDYRVMAIVYVPYFAVSLMAWALYSIKARRLVSHITVFQRWKMVIAMLSLPFAAFVFELSRLPQTILFGGPLQGFYPLTPAIVMFDAFVVPLVFWVVVGKWEASHV